MVYESKKMNKNGHSKLLAAVAVFVMVACVFAVMPAGEADGIETPTENVTMIDDLADLSGKTSGVYVLSKSVATTSTNKTIPEGVTLYTNGFTITANSTDKLTVNGTLYVNGVGGGIIVSDTSDLVITKSVSAEPKVSVDKDGSLKMGTTTIIGTEGNVVVESGTISIVTNANGGYDATIDENTTVTLNDYTTYSRDQIIVSENATLKIAGTVTNGGTITNNGTITITGTADKAGVLTNNGTITNKGTVNFTGTGYFTGTLPTGGVFNAYTDGTNYGLLTTVAQTNDKGEITKGVRLYGNDNTNMTFAVANVSSGPFFGLAAGASYTGTLTFIDETNKITYIVGVSITDAIRSQIQLNASSSALEITGKITSTSNGIPLASNTTITSVTTVDGNTTDRIVPTILVDDVAIDGTITAPITVVNQGVALVPSGANMRFSQGGTIAGAGTDKADLYIIGDVTGSNMTAENQIITTYLNVTTNNLSKVTSYIDDANNATEVDLGVTVITTQDQLNQLETYAAAGPVQLGDGTNALIIQVMGPVELSTTIYIPNTTLVVIGEWDKVASSLPKAEQDLFGSATTLTLGDSSRGTLTLKDATVYSYKSGDNETSDSAAQGKDSIVVADKNSLEIINSKVFAVVNADEDLVEVNNKGVVYENTTSGVMVGYGTTLNLSGTVDTNIIVYGNLIIGSNVTVNPGYVLAAYRGANVTVDGSVSILGTAHFYDGSTTVVNGTMSLDDKTYGVTMTVGEDPYEAASTGANFTISETGTVSLLATQSIYNSYNKLDINNPEASYSKASGWTPRFLVQGTLTMNGQLSGDVHDMGTVTVNGASDSGNIILYSGYTLTVNSVKGTLTVSDTNVLDESKRTVNKVDIRRTATGNSVTLEGVRGVTVSVSTGTVNWTDSNDVAHTDYYTIMDVTGTFTSVNDKVAGAKVTMNASSATTGVGKNNKTLAELQISQNVTLGKNVELAFGAGNTKVSGEVNALTEDSLVSNSAEVTVTGHIQVREDEIDSRDGINAMHYEVTPTSGTDTYTIHHYTGFKAAVDAGLDADNDTVELLGTVTATETATIPAGLTVQMDMGAQLVVDEDATVTLANGASIDGMSSSIDVDGTFVAENINEGFDVSESNIYADVIIDETPKKTWTSLANALANSKPGDRIVLNQKIVISKDTTIPAGVEVYTNVPVTAPEANAAVITIKDDAELTVEGTLTMDNKTEGSIDFTDGELTVNGQFSAKIITDVDTYRTQSGIGALPGAHYVLMDKSYDVVYVSSVNVAATNVSDNANLESEVLIKGVLTATDATFAGAEGEAAIRIVVQQMAAGADNMTVLNMTGATLTLENAVLSVGENCRVTGDIATGTAKFTASNVGGITIEDVVEEEPETVIETATGVTATGKLTVTSGAVVIDSTMTVAKDAYLGVASGATMVLEEGASVVTTAGAKDATVVIDGTVVVEKGAGINAVSEVRVNGTMDVKDDFAVTGILRIAGQMNIAEDKTLSVGKTGTGAAAGTLIIGAKPTQLGQSSAGAVDGVVTIASNGVVLAYAGADLSKAEIDINPATKESDAAITSYVINGQAYATVYKNGTTSDNILDSIYDIDGGINLSGWDTPDKKTGNTVNKIWFDSEECNPANDECVDAETLGDYATVYAVFEASEIMGTISKDAGIILTIDDIVVNQEYGYGDASQTLTYGLSVGTHTISWSERTGYNIENVTVTFNGEAVENGATITITADMQDFTIIAQGAVPGAAPSAGSDDGMGLTDYLLIVLVVLIVVMAIMVALRLMRS